MTKDVIALTQRMPDPASLLVGLLAGGPDRLVGAQGDGAVVHLCDAEGRPFVSVESPLLVHRGRGGTAARGEGTSGPLLVDGGPGHHGCRRGRAPGGHVRGQARHAARRLRLPGGGARSLEVVQGDGAGLVPAPAAAQPAVDVLTDKVAVVIQDRPVVAMTAWLSDAFRAAAEGGLGLQIVTPPSTTLSPAVRNALPGWPSRWVVQDERDGYYDGLSGAVLRWQDGLFAPVEAAGSTPDDRRAAVATTYQEVTATDERQLALTVRTVHPADERLVLGGALETVWRELTGEPPAGWGTAEPANLPWSPRRLTDVAFERAPEPTWAVVVGGPSRPALATVRIRRTKAGVEEDITLNFGYGSDEEPPLDALPRTAEALATRHHLQSMLIQLRKARRDLAVPPRFEGPGVPLAFVLGAEEVRQMPDDRARKTPLSEPPVQLGPRTRPALYYPLPGDPSDLSGWQDFELLMRHLKGE